MVTKRNKNTNKSHKNQVFGGRGGGIRKIKASTPYDFKGKQLTPFGGLLPLATMLEKLRFKELIEEVVIVHRKPKSMGVYQFILSILLALYLGLDRLNHMVHISLDPIITGMLHVACLPVQSTFWRFLQSLRIFNVVQLKRVNQEMLGRVWDAANIGFSRITIDTDTTVNTIYGKQAGGRRGYNPKHRGKKSYQPILSFISETGEYITGRQRSGDNLTGEEIARHIHEAFASLPPQVKRVRSRADAGLYCKEAVEAYKQEEAEFIIVAQKTSRLKHKLNNVRWERAKDTEGVTEFFYQPVGWAVPERFVSVRFKKEEEPQEQYQLFETEQYTYRVFVTNIKGSPLRLMNFYDGRADAENLIKEANNDAGVASVPSRNFIANMNFFLLAMLAYNFNRWLMLFNVEEGEVYKRTMLSTARLKYIFLAAKIISHSGRTRICYSDHYQYKEKFHALMHRLRQVRRQGERFLPVFKTPISVFR